MLTDTVFDAAEDIREARQNRRETYALRVHLAWQRTLSNF